MFKNIIATAIIASLTACGGGGGGSSASTTPIMPNQPSTGNEVNHPVSQLKDVSIIPAPVGQTKFYVYDAVDNVLQYPHPQSNEWSFSIRHQGRAVINMTMHQNQSMFEKTGVSLDGVPAHGNGSSFYGSSGNMFQSYIDSTSFSYEVIRGAGPHSVVAYYFKDMPKAVGLTLKAEFAIPSFQTEGGVGQLSIAGYLHDCNNRSIAFVFVAFDNRVSDYEPNVMSDTYVSFVSQPLHATKFATPINENRMTNTTFNGFKEFGVTFTEENIKNIIAGINEFNTKNNVPLISTDVGCYKLDSIVILHEIFNFSGDNYVKMGVGVKNIDVTRKQ